MNAATRNETLARMAVGLVIAVAGCDRKSGPHEPSATTSAPPSGALVDGQTGVGDEGSDGEDGEGTTGGAETDGDTDGDTDMGTGSGDPPDTTAGDDGGDRVQVLGDALSAGPPTQARCDGMPAKAGCHYALIPSSYCGGAAPSEEMMWPSCQCSVCSRDEHCGRGERCVMLPTDAECHPQVMVCVNPKRGCTSSDDCTSPRDQCMAVGQRSACRPPTMYPPRP